MYQSGIVCEASCFANGPSTPSRDAVSNIVWSNLIKAVMYPTIIAKCKPVGHRKCTSPTTPDDIFHISGHTRTSYPTASDMSADGTTCETLIADTGVFSSSVLTCITPHLPRVGLLSANGPSSGTLNVFHSKRSDYQVASPLYAVTGYQPCILWR